MTTYLDSTATTKPTDLALRSFNEISRNCWGNPSSTLYEFGADAKRKLNDCRKVIATLIHAKPEQIIFTSGSTEAANTIIQGYIPRGREKDYIIITSPIEHPAVSQTVQYMQSCGVKVFKLSCSHNGLVNTCELKYYLDNFYMYNILVCIMDANNEIGCVQPTVEIAKIIHQYPNVRLFTDMTQSFAHSRIYGTDELNYDFACASAQKFGGLKGTGFLYAKNPNDITPLIYGGGQEFGKRSGTENLAGIYSMTMQFIDSCIKREQEQEKIESLNIYLRNKLGEIKCEIVSNKDNALPNILSVFLIDDVDAQEIVSLLDLNKIMLSVGSACSTNKDIPSKTLISIGFSPEESKRVLRISLNANLTTDDIDYFIDKLKGVL